MISNIALFLIFGKPLIAYLGILTLISLLSTALLGFLNFKGIHTIPFKWHPRMAFLTISLALIHGFLGISITFGF